MRDIQEPLFIPLKVWHLRPLLSTTLHNDMIEALETYDVAREFVLLALGEKSPDVGLYTWWKIPLAALVSI